MNSYVIESELIALSFLAMNKHSYEEVACLVGIMIRNVQGGLGKLQFNVRNSKQLFKHSLPRGQNYLRSSLCHKTSQLKSRYEMKCILF